MSVAVWVLQGLLALALLGAGALKLVRSRERLAEVGLEWAQEFTAPGVRFVGALEVLAALGLVLPAATGVAVVATGLAALGAAAVTAGAVATHVRRGDPAVRAVPALGLGLVALVIAAARLGPVPF